MPRHSRTQTVHSRPYQSFPGTGRSTGRRGFSGSLQNLWNGARPYVPGIVNGLAATYSNASTVRVSRKSSSVLSAPMRTEKPKLDGTGGLVGHCRYPSGRNFIEPGIYRSLAPYVNVGNSADQLLSPVGFQQQKTAYLGLNSSDVLTLSSRFNTATTGLVGRVFIERIHSELLLCNNFLGNAVITLYDVVARRDINSTPGNDPSTAWSLGIVDQIGTAGASSIMMGGTPFDSDLFNQYWKVVQKTSAVLGQGASYRHIIDWRINKMIHEEVAANTTCIGGLTHATLLVLTGQPANDITTKTQVSIGKAGVDIVRASSVTYKFPANSSTKIFTANTLLSAFTVAEDIVDVGSGAIGPNTEA